MILSPTLAAARLVERLCRLSGALASGVAALADGRPVDLLAAADALDDLAEALPAPPVEPLPGVRWPLRDLAAALRDTATALRLASPPGGGGGGPPEGGVAVECEAPVAHVTVSSERVAQLRAAWREKP